MEISVGTTKFDEYLSALKELNDAQSVAREFGALVPPRSNKGAQELPPEGKKAYQRLVQASEVYAKKYKAWKDSLKAYGL